MKTFGYYAKLIDFLYLQEKRLRDDDMRCKFYERYAQKTLWETFEKFFNIFRCVLKYIKYSKHVLRTTRIIYRKYLKR